MKKAALVIVLSTAAFLMPVFVSAAIIKQQPYDTSSLANGVLRWVMRYTPTETVTVKSFSVGACGSSGLDIAVYNAAGTTLISSSGSTKWDTIDSDDCDDGNTYYTMASTTAYTFTAGTKYYFSMGYGINNSTITHYGYPYAVDDELAMDSVTLGSIDSTFTPTTSAPIEPFFMACDEYGTCASTSTVQWDAIWFPTVYDADFAGIAASSSLWGQYEASTTLATINNCALAGNIFSQAICSAGAYLFTVSTGVFQKIAEIPTYFAARFPFSWILGLYNVWGDMTATTDDFQTLEIDMQSWDRSTTTAFGGILPSITFLSSSTISTYMPNGFMDTAFLLMRAAIWIGFLSYIIISVRKRFTATLTI